MKLIFIPKISLGYRFILAILLAIILIITDINFDIFNRIRIYVDNIIGPFYKVSYSIMRSLSNTLQVFYSCNNIKLENQILRKELLIKNSELLLIDQYKRENFLLRKLLNSPLLKNEKKTITQVISTINYPYKDQIIINKGSKNNVHEGQPVISDKGIIGQVITVAKSTSRVLLICNINHALPVQVLRNGIRVIASGNGCNEDLQLNYIPSNADIRIGDLLVTSGLGNKFPEGYPVAVVSSIKLDNKCTYRIIQAHPTSNFENLHFLLLWERNQNSYYNPLTSEEVRQLADKRLFK